jgi:hypothetical protein
MVEYYIEDGEDNILVEKVMSLEMGLTDDQRVMLECYKKLGKRISEWIKSKGGESG